MKKNGFTLLEIVLSLIVLSGVVFGAYYLGKNTNQKGSPDKAIQNTISPSISTAQSEQIAEPLFSGKVKKRSNDLGLFKITDLDKENGVPESLVYYEAGTFLRGELTGYTRILAIRPSEGPGPSLQFLLATKNFNSFVLNDPQNKTINYPETDWDNPYMYLDKNKISRTASFESEHPITLSVKPPFLLIRRDEALTENKKTNTKDKNGNDIYLDTPITDFEKSFALSSNNKRLSLYAGATDWSNSQPQNEKEKAALATRNTYLQATTLVHAVDSTGLTYTYVISTEKDVASYIKATAANEQKNIEYKKQLELYNEKKLKEYPTSPTYAEFPSLRFSRSAAGLSTDFFTSYDAAFPGACGGALSTFVVDGLTQADLTPVTSASEYPLFSLKDTQHPLIALSLQTKSEQGEELFKEVNKGMSIPSLESYGKKHPLLFFKDAWDRWIVVGEFDLQLMGGCGKPVVYLYPEKQTEVRLSFASPVVLNTNIPTYTNGWFVSASPDGTLTDLQSYHTDCSKIDATHEGSEYAAEACSNNAYPYIYWSGKSVQNSYPKVTGGWVVKKQNLKSVLAEKLISMGLTKKEVDDMTSYWVPKMSEKKTPYYRISFIQTQDMNAFVPMRVSPQPDSVLRVFLDWQGLSEMPRKPLPPQPLQKFVRSGFSYVEWGGLEY